MFEQEGGKVALRASAPPIHEDHDDVHVRYDQLLQLRAHAVSGSVQRARAVAPGCSWRAATFAPSDILALALAQTHRRTLPHWRIRTFRRARNCTLAHANARTTAQ
eukprot:6206449-Pleurochrysis_carterae.AAC.1